MSENPDLDVLDWHPPGWLAAVYAVHDGLGRWDPVVGFLPGSLLPWSEVTPLTRHVRFGEENIAYDPADCIRISVDPYGGGLTICGREAGLLRWFDGQTHHLSKPLELGEALYRVALLSTERSR